MEKKEEEIRANPTKGTEKISPFRLSQISLWLDSYNNIFSDFDPRSYNQRALSDDFLSEIKRASSDKASGSIELSFLIKKNKRNSADESTIKRRLKAHFKRHEELLKKEKNKIIVQGLLFSMAGVLLMFAATIIIFRFGYTSLMLSFLIVMMEPAGWFSFWEGLNTMYFESKRVNPELEFYNKMNNAEIVFTSEGI